MPAIQQVVADDPQAGLSSMTIEKPNVPFVVTDAVADWRIKDLETAAERAALAAESRILFPTLSLYQDVDWLGVASNKPNERLVALIDREDGVLQGLAAFHVHPTRLTFSLGELSLLSVSVQRYALDAEPLTRRSSARTATDACFSVLADTLTPKNVVFLGGVPKESALQELIDDPASALRRKFHVVPFGAEYLRCRVRWTGDYEAYLSSLSTKDRSKLRRALRRFGEAEHLTGEVRRFQQASDIEAFLAAAVPVSEKTYQHRLLGLGLTKDGASADEIREAAARGWFLGHILRVNGEPAAFHYGFVFSKCFFMIAAGYDPAYMQNEVGTVLFLEVLKDIEKVGDDIELMDNLYGGGIYKERSSNLKTPERHYYLIPKTFRGAILAKSMIATDRSSRALGDLLEKYGLKDRIKKLIRRTAARPKTT